MKTLIIHLDNVVVASAAYDGTLSGSVRSLMSRLQRLRPSEITPYSNAPAHKYRGKCHPAQQKTGGYRYDYTFCTKSLAIRVGI